MLQCCRVSAAGDAVLTVTNLEKLLATVMTRTSQSPRAEIEHGSLDLLLLFS